jgi:hypothetical protein
VHYRSRHCGALLQDVFPGRYCGALLQDVIAGVIAGHYSRSERFCGALYYSRVIAGALFRDAYAGHY